MKFITYYLKFNAPLHLGNHRPDTYDTSEEFLRSDTIVAAIFATWAKMGHEDWIPVDGNPSFTVSSAFPFIESESGKTHFFPRPKLRFNNQEDLSDIRKKVKKVNWLDQNYFEKVIGNEPIPSFGINNADLKDKYLSTKGDPSIHIKKDMMQRVSISRGTREVKDSEPFYMERIVFKDAGLYFLVEGNDDRVQSAMEYLQYEGFGTDRTVGNGFYDLEVGEIDLKAPQDSTLRTNLGLFTPESRDQFEQSTDHSDAAFEAVKRGGWITTEAYLQKEKKKVHMFTEGGVWKIDETISGKSDIDLTPSSLEINHKIWRSGRTIFIPIKL